MEAVRGGEDREEPAPPPPPSTMTTVGPDKVCPICAPSDLACLCALHCAARARNFLARAMTVWRLHREERAGRAEVDFKII